MSPLEITASVLGFICVFLTIRQNIYTFPIGIVSAFLYIFIFFEARLYSDMILQGFFILFQAYGWYNWLYGGGEHSKLPVSSNSVSMNLVWFLVGAFSSVLIGWYFHTFSDAALPFWDSNILAFSLVAQWLMSVKKIEHWIYWILIDVLATGIYFVRELYLTSLLYFLFMILAVIGLIEWRKVLLADSKVT
jgi:nicotinamide mononucleotide transporter